MLRGRGSSYRIWALGGSALAMIAALPARAFTYQFNDGVQIRFDNDVEYSLTERTAPTSNQITNQLNGNDGDLNLAAGIVSNRVQDVTSFEISDNGYGFDASAEGFYDSVYESKTQNTNQNQENSITSVTEFPNGSSALVGRNIEARNLFVYGTFNAGNVPINFRIGRHTLIWGESLFFPDNGIAYGMAPLDGVEASSEPNAEAKDLFLPVGMASVSAQLTDTLRFEAYYQFEWEKTIIPPAGSYFGSSDIFDGGGQRIIAEAPNSVFPGFPGVFLTRGPDERGASTGQFGVALHYDPDASPYDFGFYALQFNDREPQIYSYGQLPVFTANGLIVGKYRLVYPDHIQLYGASASTTIGAWNIAGEVSARIGTPITNQGVTVAPGQLADNNNHPLYPTGDVAYQQISTIYLGPATKFWGGSSFVAELAGNELLSVLKNGQEFVASNGGGPGHWDAVGFHAIFTPSYYEIRPDTDLSVPLGLAYNFWGQSPTSHVFNGTDQNHGGVATIGLSLAYRSTWNAGITYAQYFGPVAQNNVFADRSNISLSLQHTF